MFRKMVEV